MPVWLAPVLKILGPLGPWLDKHLKLWGAFRAGKKSAEGKAHTKSLETERDHLKETLKDTGDLSRASERDLDDELRGG